MTRMKPSRRELAALAAGIGASLAFGRAGASPPASAVQERRDLYPQGVASGDPYLDSVVLWRRRPPVEGNAANGLVVEIARDEAFRNVVALHSAPP